MSFGGTGGRDCRTGFVTCLECNKHEVTGFELLCGSQESDTPGRDAWKCPACSNLSYTDSMLKNMRFVEIAANGGPRGDDTDDGEEPSTDGLREDEVELEVPKQGISRVALDTPKSGGSNSSALENPVVFEGRRVNAILNDLVECEDQVSAIRHRLVRLIRDVQDFYFENNGGDDEGMSLLARKAMQKIHGRFILNREAHYLLEREMEFQRMLEMYRKEGAHDVAIVNSVPK